MNVWGAVAVFAGAVFAGVRPVPIANSPDIGQTARAVRTSPEEMALTVGETRPLTMVDATGREVENVTWTISSPRVAAVSTWSDVGPAPPSLVGISRGRVIVTGHSALGTAHMVVHVYGSTGVPPGTPLWVVYPDTTGDRFQDVVIGRDRLYVTEKLEPSRFAVIAYDIFGAPLWRKDYREPVSDVSHTAGGGLVLRVGLRLTKLSADGDIEWAHEPDPTDYIWSDSYVGVLYGALTDARTMRIWDIETGALRSEVRDPLDQGQVTVTCGDGSTQPRVRFVPNTVVQGASGFDQDYYYAEQVHHDAFVGEAPCLAAGTAAQGVYVVNTDTYLVRISPRHSVTTTLVRRDTDSVRAVATSSNTAGYTFTPLSPATWIPSTIVHRIFPGAGMLLLMEHRGGSSREEVLVRELDGLIQYSIPAPPPGVHSQMSVTDAFVTLLSDRGASGVGETAGIDSRSGKTLWRTSRGQLLCTTYDDGVLVVRAERRAQGVVTTIEELDGHGAPTGHVTTLPGNVLALSPQYWSPGALVVRDPGGGRLRVLSTAGVAADRGVIVGSDTK